MWIYQGEVKLHVKPGTYNIKISKKGYISDSHVVEPKFVGEEKTVIFSLRPVSTQPYLPNAEIAIRQQNLKGPSRSFRPGNRPNNSKSNLLTGKAYFQKPQSGGRPIFN